MSTAHGELCSLLFDVRVYSLTLGEPAHRLMAMHCICTHPQPTPFFNGSDKKGEDGAFRQTPRRRVHLEPLRRDWVGGCGLKTDDTSVRLQTRATFSHTVKQEAATKFLPAVNTAKP